MKNKATGNVSLYLYLNICLGIYKSLEPHECVITKHFQSFQPSSTSKREKFSQQTDHKQKYGWRNIKGGGKGDPGVKASNFLEKIHFNVAVASSSKKNVAILMLILRIVLFLH